MLVDRERGSGFSSWDQQTTDQQEMQKWTSHRMSRNGGTVQFPFLTVRSDYWEVTRQRLPAESSMKTGWKPNCGCNQQLWLNVWFCQQNRKKSQTTQFRIKNSKASMKNCNQAVFCMNGNFNYWLIIRAGHIYLNIQIFVQWMGILFGLIRPLNSVSHRVAVMNETVLLLLRAPSCVNTVQLYLL